MSDTFVTPWTAAHQSSVHGISQPTGVGCHFLLQGSSWPRDRTWVFYIGRWILYTLSHQGSPSEDIVRCQRFKALCLEPSLEPTVEGTGTNLLPPNSATGWPDPTVEARIGWTFSFLLSFFFERHLILWFGFFSHITKKDLENSKEL